MSGGFVKIYGTILDSSLWSEDVYTRILFLAMLAMADAEGQVMASLPGLARRANLPLDKTTEALQVLMSPDEHDRSGVDEGRRVRAVQGGWTLVNYERYRDMRTESQIAKAARQQRWRDGKRLPVDDVDGRETEVSVSQSVSQSLSAVDLEKPKDATAQFASRFGRFAGVVEGFIRSARSPDAIMATLNLHLTGELSHEQAEPEQVGLAVQQYMAAGEARFSAPYFAGFIRRVKRGQEVTENRKRIAAEHVAIEQQAEAAVEEEGEDAELLGDYKAAHPDAYAELLKQAAVGVPPGMFYDTIVQARLLTLIRRDVHANR